MRRKDREVSSREDIAQIMDMCKTCHLAMIDGDRPYIVPLSYGYSFTDAGVLELYFHSALEGKKLDVLRKNNKVCFELSREGELTGGEDSCNYGYYYASVIGQGEVVFLSDTGDKCSALSVLFRHQTGRDAEFNEKQVQNVCVFKIVSADYTGKMKRKHKG